MPRSFVVAGLVLLVSFLGSPSSALAAEKLTRNRLPQPRQDAPVRVFVDCVDVFCDFDYMRTEIPYVTYVRSREDAQVHVLVTAQPTGSGGREYSLRFIGRDRFTGNDASLLFTASQTDTEDQRRRGLTRTLALGLIDYVVETAIADQIELRYRLDGAASTAAAAGPLTPADDPWNFWVLRTSFSLNTHSEEEKASSTYYVGLSANRTTEDWKIGVGFNGRYSEQRFELDEGPLTNVARNVNLSSSLVRSLSDRWSLAGRGSVSSSTYLNQDLASRAAGGIEYSVFPYSEASRRRLVVQYLAGVRSFDYDVETIFDKTEETIADQALEMTLDLKQPWGSSRVGIEGGHLLADASKYHLAFDGDIDVRLFKGFSLNLATQASLIRDQLYLPRVEATPEEVLLQQRQLATSYRFEFAVGFSYTFGSIFNNVVNRRFID
jgi:hypothetical protein